MGIPQLFHTVEADMQIADFRLGNATYTPSHLQAELNELKQPDRALLEAASPYIRAIISPNDTTFPRLECPASNGIRYKHLKSGVPQLEVQDFQSTPKYFALDLRQIVLCLSSREDRSMVPLRYSCRYVKRWTESD